MTDKIEEKVVVEENEEKKPKYVNPALAWGLIAVELIAALGIGYAIINPLLKLLA